MRRPSPKPSANPSRSRWVRGGPGCRRVSPRRWLVPGLAYAAVCKQRKEGRVVSVRRKVVLGSRRSVNDMLRESAYSRTINPSFVERRHATDRGQTTRK